jgi:hypothetical protein
VINSFPETPIEVQATFDYDEDASELEVKEPPVFPLVQQV